MTLPNGSHIEDPRSPTGYVMAPFNDLKEVAAAARRERQGLDKRLGPPNVAELPARFAATLAKYLGHGGVFDYQRRENKAGRGGFTQLPQFRSASNVNVGLFCQQLGVPLSVTLVISGLFALLNSSNRRIGEPFFLDPDTKKYIEIGYRLGQAGPFDEQDANIQRRSQ